MTAEAAAKVEWIDTLSVGVGELDDDHKNLIRIINRVLACEREGGSVKWALGELSAYAKDHFRREEQMMEKAGYPKLESHREAHQSFTEWLSSLSMLYGSDPGAEYYLAETMREYLQNWLTDHIMKVDSDYKGQLN